MVPVFLRQKFILFLTKLSTKRLYYFFKSQSAKPIFILCFSKFIIYKTILSLTQICSLIFTYWSVTTTFYIFRVKNIVQTINNNAKHFLFFKILLNQFMQSFFIISVASRKTFSPRILVYIQILLNKNISFPKKAGLLF